MASPPSLLGAAAPTFSISPSPSESSWYAIYTRPRHEKQIGRHLASRAVEHFLPLYRSVRQWKDRRMVVELPLFAGYVFVRLDLRERMRVLTTPGVVGLVGPGGVPSTIPNCEIANLHSCIERQVPLKPHSYLTVGQTVLVRRGPLAGVEGMLLRYKNRSRLVLSINLIRGSVVLELDDTDVVPVTSHSLSAQA